MQHSPPSKAPVAFVAGSTGYVGQAVVHALRERGIATHAHARPNSGRAEQLRPSFEAQGAALVEASWEPASLGEALSTCGATHVFCLIGTTRKQASAEGESGDIYDRIDKRLAIMLANACGELEPSARYIYLSSVGASVAASSKYLQARGHAEAAIQGLGLSSIIARPSFITGPDRSESRPGERIGATLADGALGLVGLLGASKARKKYSSTTASDLATRLVDLALGSEEGVFEGSDLSLRP